jgi:hypothetical protein
MSQTRYNRTCVVQHWVSVLTILRAPRGEFGAFLEFKLASPRTARRRHSEPALQPLFFWDARVKFRYQLTVHFI